MVLMMGSQEIYIYLFYLRYYFVWGFIIFLESNPDFGPPSIFWKGAKKINTDIFKLSVSDNFLCKTLARKHKKNNSTKKV